MVMTEQNDGRELALVPIAEALPALRTEQYAKVREWDAARMQLADGYEAADGEYLIKIRDALKPVRGLWKAYYTARELAESTVNYRIRRAEGNPYPRYEKTSTVEVFPKPTLLPPAPAYHAPLDAEWRALDADEAPSDNDWPPPDRSFAHAQPALPTLPTLPTPRRAQYSIAEWNALDASERAAIIAAGHAGATGLNEQKSDSIEWAMWSWNPVTGCLHNCPYCYARDIANRFYTQKFVPTFLPDRLGAPAHQKVPAQAETELGYRNIFTCSMADLFGKWVPTEWIEAVLDVARGNPQWNFLFLTKFPVRLAEFTFPENAWLGTSVDCQARVKNAERSFAKVRGGVKWLSIEPMLEPIRFDSLDMFNWVVIGGASASTETPEWHPPRHWVDDLEAQARAAGCMIYEKANLQARLREYPGWQRSESTLPASLAYLPTIGQGLE